MNKEEFEERFNELVEELELQSGDSIDIGCMLGANAEMGVRCEIWAN